MPSVEERLAYLEGQVSEHSHAFGDLREASRQLEHRMDTRFDAMERRFEAIDRRFEAIDRRFEAVDRRFEGIDRRFDSIDHRFDILDQKISRQFVWLVGIQVSTLVAVVGAVVTVAAAFVSRS